MSGVEPDPVSDVRPRPLRRRWLRNRWADLVFVHWAYPPEVVQALLPHGLTVDTFDGQAFVSLVPFRMRDAAPRRVPAIPWISSFLETNVRTYVIDAAGHRAVWFFSLEADRLAIVAFARSLLGFPYIWSDLTYREDGTRRRYETLKRRWPRRTRSTTSVVVQIGDELAAPDDLDVFLTARWGAVAQSRRGTLRHHPVDHETWRLHEATLLEYHDHSFDAAGLPVPEGEPIVRFAQPVEARFGWPERV